MGVPPGGKGKAPAKGKPPAPSDYHASDKKLTYAEKKALQIEEEKRAAEQALRENDARVAELEAQGFAINTTPFLEEYLSGPEHFSGKPDDELTPEEFQALRRFGTDQPPGGPYGGKKFQPTRGYFACKGCGSIMYLPVAKFVH
eukprot:TRINITY_DN49420_c0_g1_i1.p1 TRINITY_DN49420_c0_g1~~TRINITY_DN49420_c0_g1_i1.p1  ORF type:complete len:144 (-),score=29.21 TRINITY_DN49420_c0_g1_i1:443-874(-)